jgi:hypothetical protein
MAINYQFDVINPFQAALQGYGAGAQILQQERSAAQQARQEEQQSQLFALQMEEARARAAKVQQEMANAERVQLVMADFYDKVAAGTITAKDVAMVKSVNAEVGTFGEEMLSKMSDDAKRVAFGNLTRPLAALMLGQNDVAKADFETQYEAALNSGDQESADAVKIFLDQMGTEEGRTFLKATLMLGAAEAEPEKGMFDTAFKGIQQIKNAPMEAEKGDLEMQRLRAQIARDRAEVNKIGYEQQAQSSTGSEVQSSKILDDGTFIAAMKDGTRIVRNPQGQIVEGDEAQRVIAEANRVGTELQGQRAGARAGATLGPKEAFTALSNVQRNISNLDQVVEAIDRGASTGVIESTLPAWDASTIELRNLQSRLGLDVIGSVTFGALSEGELNLALATALPTNLTPADLRKWVINKKTAQEKLATYLNEQARFLSIPGSTVGDWLAHVEAKTRMGATTGSRSSVVPLQATPRARQRPTSE